MSAVENPTSKKTVKTLTKANAIATKPNSSGASNLAKIILTTNVLPWVRNLPRISQEKARIVCFLIEVNGFLNELNILQTPNLSNHQYQRKIQLAL